LLSRVSFPSNFHIILLERFLGNFIMTERKKKVSLTANLKIALIKCSQELKNQVELLTKNNIHNLYSLRMTWLLYQSVLATYTAEILLK
jgi:hypothetical protein